MKKRTQKKSNLKPVPITKYFSDSQSGGKTINKPDDIEDSDKLLKDKYKHIINYFQKTMPNAPFELNYNNGYELIVSLVLSARQTDKGVNELTPILFLP